MDTIPKDTKQALAILWERVLVLQKNAISKPRYLLVEASVIGVIGIALTAIAKKLLTGIGL